MSGYLLDVVFQLALTSTLLLGITSAVVVLLRRASASLRHVVWRSCLVALLLAPTMPFLLPAWSVSASVPLIASGSISRAAAAAAPQGEVPSSRTTRPIASAHEAPQAPPTDAESAAMGRLPWLDAVAIAYVVVASLLALNLGLRVWRVRRRLSNLRETAHADTSELIAHMARCLGVERGVRTVVDPRETTPWTWGVLHPVIALPPRFVEWPMEERRYAVAHELAHIDRMDLLSGVLARLCAAIYWFQPLVWLAVHQMNREAEYACDDRVLLAGASSSGYAAQLVKLARSIHLKSQETALVSAMAGSPPLSRRVGRILASTTRRKTVSKFLRLTTLATALLLTAPVMTLRSQQTSSDTAAAAPADPDPEAEAIVNRGAGSEAELATALGSLLERKRPEEARSMLVDWLLRDPFHGCELCVRVLDTPPGPGSRSNGSSRPTRSFVFSAFEQVEALARARNDSGLLMRLVQILAETRDQEALNLGAYYLFQARSLGELSGAQQLIAVAFLVESGQYDTALEVARKLHEDSTSSYYQSESTKRWIDYLESRRALMSRLAKRLGEDDLAGSDEFMPVYKASPTYPAEAAQNGIEGYVIVEFTVTAAGTTEAPTVIESSNSVFNESALASVGKYRYIPRTVDDEPVDAPGVRVKLQYKLAL